MIVSPEQIAKNIMDCMPEELYEYLCEIKTPHNTNCQPRGQINLVLSSLNPKNQ